MLHVFQYLMIFNIDLFLLLVSFIFRLVRVKIISFVFFVFGVVILVSFGFLSVFRCQISRFGLRLRRLRLFISFLVIFSLFIIEFFIILLCVIRL